MSNRKAASPTTALVLIAAALGWPLAVAGDAAAQSTVPSTAATTAPATAQKLPTPPVKPAASATPVPAQMQAPLQVPNSAVQLSGLSPVQMEALAGINRYFNSIRTLTGSFVQFGPEGQRTEGDFYLSKPGKIHFVYAAPSTLEVVSDGRDVVVKERLNQTQDLYPLSQTPLKFLLADQLDLTAEANVTKVSVEPDLVTVVVEQKTVVGDGRLALVFTNKTYELKQWTVTDSQGYDTSVAIYGLAANVPVDETQFKINEIPILGSKGR
ncbi:MAG: outer-membrane lipoprotein carrier protein LolA [Ancalomicrobiaceae bacterium]|nr:outer-membrane lipoprotein carrier protein LolA [Ancalomicrobiaceae bacterium]